MSFESFSVRALTTDPRVVTSPSITTPPGPDMNQLYAAAVNNQLLVSEDVATAVEQALDSRKIKWKVLTTLLDGITSKVEDVWIYELELPLPGGLNVFTLAEQLRDASGVADLDPTKPRKVSPNHVLIPALDGWNCPHGAPSSTTLATLRPVPFPPAEPPVQHVAVIDAGYQWNPAWGQNPLGGPPAYARGEPFIEQEAEQLPSFGAVPAPPGHGHWKNGTADVGAWAIAAAANVSPEIVGAGPPYVLVALAGHANFVAGVIAQHCANAQITIHNHNGSFILAENVQLPTEATVARSICRSAGSGASIRAEVINVGFAFPAYGDQVSCIWQRALAQIGPGPIVVAPAGNQGVSTPPRYPAGLEWRYPGLFPQVIGVGSWNSQFELPGVIQRSSFSNYGPWVNCAAVGVAVVSTFLNVDQELEDQVAPANVQFGNSLASWNGTSFAAPKVTAAICDQLVNGAPTPMAALNAVLATGLADPALEIGPILQLG
jgi:hypothetical protein